MKFHYPDTRQLYQVYIIIYNYKIPFSLMHHSSLQSFFINKSLSALEQDEDEIDLELTHKECEAWHSHVHPPKLVFLLDTIDNLL